MKESFKKFTDFYAKNAIMINCCVLLALTICSLVNEIFGAFCLGAFMLMCVFSSEEKGFYYLMVLAPFSTSMGFLKSGEILFYYLISINIVILFIKALINKTLKISTPILIIFACLIVYMALPIGQYNLQKIQNISVLLLIIVGIYFVYIYRNKIDFYKLARIGLYSLIVSFLVSFKAGYFANRTVFQGIWPFMFGSRYGAMFSNVNFLSMYSIVLASLFASFVFINDKKLVPLIMFLITIGVGLFSLSKSYVVLSVILILLMFVGVLVNGYHKKYKKAFAVSIFCAGLILAMCAIVVLNRFNGIKHFLKPENLFTGRVDLWLQCLKDVTATPLTFLFGCGLEYRVEFRQAHSFYLEVFTKLGLVGTAIFITFIVLLLKKSKQNHDENKKVDKFARIIPVIVMLTYFFVESFVVHMPLFMIPLVFVLPYTSNKKSIESEIGGEVTECLKDNKALADGKQRDLVLDDNPTGDK